MLMHLAAPRPFMVVSVPYSASPSITKSKISTWGGISNSLIEIGRNKPNFPSKDHSQQALLPSTSLQFDVHVLSDMEH